MRFVIRVLIAALLVLGLGFYCWQYMEGIRIAELEAQKLIETRLKEEVQILQELKDAHEREKVSLRTQLENMQVRAEAAEEAARNLKAASDGLDKDIKDLALQHADAEEELKQADERIQQLEKAAKGLEEAKERIQRLELDLQQSQHLLDEEKNSHVDALRNSLQLESQLERLNTSFLFQTTQLEEALYNLDEARHSARTLTQQLGVAVDGWEASEKEKLQLQGALEESLKAFEDLQQLIESAHKARAVEEEQDGEEEQEEDAEEAEDAKEENIEEKAEGIVRRDGRERDREEEVDEKGQEDEDEEEEEEEEGADRLDLADGAVQPDSRARRSADALDTREEGLRAAHEADGRPKDGNLDAEPKARDKDAGVKEALRDSQGDVREGRAHAQRDEVDDEGDGVKEDEDEEEEDKEEDKKEEGQDTGARRKPVKNETGPQGLADGAVLQEGRIGFGQAGNTGSSKSDLGSDRSDSAAAHKDHDSQLISDHAREAMMNSDAEMRDTVKNATDKAAASHELRSRNGSDTASDVNGNAGVPQVKKLHVLPKIMQGAAAAAADADHDAEDKGVEVQRLDEHGARANRGAAEPKEKNRNEDNREGDSQEQ